MIVRVPGVILDHSRTPKTSKMGQKYQNRVKIARNIPIWGVLYHLTLHFQDFQVENALRDPGGARGASLASRLGEARVVKSPAGVAKKKANALRSVFPAGMFVSGKKQVASGKAAKKRGNAKRR